MINFGIKFFSTIVIVSLIWLIASIYLISSPPVDIKISNRTEQGFTVSWTTTRSTIGSVYIIDKQTNTKRAYLDKRDINGVPGSYITHYVPVYGLARDNPYEIRIRSGLKLYDHDKNNAQIPIQTILPVIASLNTPDPSYGTVLDQDVKAIVGAIIYVLPIDQDGEKGTLVSTLTDDEGKFIYNIGDSRREKVNEYFQYSGSEHLISIDIGSNKVVSFSVKDNLTRPMDAIKINRGGNQNEILVNAKARGPYDCAISDANDAICNNRGGCADTQVNGWVKCADGYDQPNIDAPPCTYVTNGSGEGNECYKQCDGVNELVDPPVLECCGSPWYRLRHENECDPKPQSTSCDDGAIESADLSSTGDFTCINLVNGEWCCKSVKPTQVSTPIKSTPVETGMTTSTYSISCDGGTIENADLSSTGDFTCKNLGNGNWCCIGGMFDPTYSNESFSRKAAEYNAEYILNQAQMNGLGDSLEKCIDTQDIKTCRNEFVKEEYLVGGANEDIDEVVDIINTESKLTAQYKCGSNSCEKCTDDQLTDTGFKDNMTINNKILTRKAYAATSEPATVNVCEQNIAIVDKEVLEGIEGEIQSWCTGRDGICSEQYRDLISNLVVGILQSESGGGNELNSCVAEWARLEFSDLEVFLSNNPGCNPFFANINSTGLPTQSEVDINTVGICQSTPDQNIAVNGCIRGLLGGNGNENGSTSNFNADLFCGSCYHSESGVCAKNGVILTPDRTMLNNPDSLTSRICGSGEKSIYSHAKELIGSDEIDPNKAGFFLAYYCPPEVALDDPDCLLAQAAALYFYNGNPDLCTVYHSQATCAEMGCEGDTISCYYANSYLLALRERTTLDIPTTLLPAQSREGNFLRRGLEKNARAQTIANPELTLVYDNADHQIYDYEGYRKVARSRVQGDAQSDINNYLINFINKTENLGSGNYQALSGNTPNVMIEGSFALGSSILVTVPSLVGYTVDVANINDTGDSIFMIPLRKADGNEEGIQFVVNLNDSNTILAFGFFDDTNQNGVLDSDESKIRLVNFRFEIDEITTKVSYKLVQGWNLLAFPMETGLTASSIVKEIARQGGYATTVATYSKGKWLNYKQRGIEVFEDDAFDIGIGKGYFVKVVKPMIFELGGNATNEQVKLGLENGWNLVGMSSSSGGLSKNGERIKSDTVLQNLQAKSINADVISEFQNGQYSNTVYKDQVIYGLPFFISPQSGYFLRVDTPELIYWTEEF